MLSQYLTQTHQRRQVIKVRFRDPSSFGATDANEAEIMYREEGKLKWTSVIYNIQTNTGASQNDTKLTKFTSGTDNEYYVVYLPANIEGEDGAKNYNLTSGGCIWVCTCKLYFTRK